jgi:hypothetical protein
MPRKMKNVSIYVDVDLTVVDHMGQLLPQAVEGLLTLREAGCRLFLWSTCGADYCRQIAERYEMTPHSSLSPTSTLMTCLRLS